MLFLELETWGIEHHLCATSGPSCSFYSSSTFGSLEEGKFSLVHRTQVRHFCLFFLPWAIKLEWLLKQQWYVKGFHLATVLEYFNPNFFMTLLLFSSLSFPFPKPLKAICKTQHEIWEWITAIPQQLLGSRSFMKSFMVGKTSEGKIKHLYKIECWGNAIAKAFNF